MVVSVPVRQLELAEDYAKALEALQKRSGKALRLVLRQSLGAMLDDLQRAYSRFLSAAEPDGVDPLGRPIQRSGAAVVRETSSRFNDVVRIAQRFLPEHEIKQWTQRFARDLAEAQAIGVDLTDELAALAKPKDTPTISGAEASPIQAAAEAAGAYLSADGAAFRNLISDLTTEGIARGWGAKRFGVEVKRALAGSTDPTGKTKRMGLERRADLIARSELASAYTRAMLNQSKKLGFDYVRWIAVKDERTCPFCCSRHAHIYPVNRVVAPAHPLCRCVLSPVPQEVVESSNGPLRDNLLGQDFWRESQEEAIDEYAKAHNKSVASAVLELDRYLKLPTATEKRRYPDIKESYRPSVMLTRK